MFGFYTQKSPFDVDSAVNFDFILTARPRGTGFRGICLFSHQKNFGNFH